MSYARSGPTLPGLFADYVILGEWSAAREERLRRVPGTYVISLLDTWLSSPFAADALYDLYEALGGHRLSGHSFLERAHHDECLKQGLEGAFRDGRLVALEVPRARSAVVERAVPRQAEQDVTETTFVALELVDTDDQPVPNVKYRLTLPDGTTREGTLNANGYARVEGIPPGSCEVTFPELDGAAWNLRS